MASGLVCTPYKRRDHILQRSDTFSRNYPLLFSLFSNPTELIGDFLLEYDQKVPYLTDLGPHEG